ncbi:TolB family protein [Thalassotalea litorea]|uniref:TolB family protein n=1 Tax=Thalassotalea litorea TaxID=2020715 RepID=UPI0037353DE9
MKFAASYTPLLFIKPFCKKLNCSLAAMALTLTVSAGARAEDDIYLVNLTDDKVSHVANITQRPGYDNQPHFTPDSKALLFTAMFTVKQEDETTQQTDSMRYDLGTAQLTNLTNSAASEYSPTVTPDGEHFSVIRVGSDGRQLLWQYPLNETGADAKAKGSSLYPELFDVGYHVWLTDDELLLFVLGEPMQLQRASIDDKESHVVDMNIGRTLRKIPGTELFSYNKEHGQGWQMYIYNPEQKATHANINLPSQNMYYAWHMDGSLLTAIGNKVYQAKIDLTPTPEAVTLKQPNVSGVKWAIWQDFSKDCDGNITRMVMSEDQQHFAFVCNTEK